MDNSDDDDDVCRVCRTKGTPSKPLFYPCMCSGSIKYTHNDCLIRWLSHSKRELCELCNHHITFSTIYAHGMPSRLPIKDVLTFIVMIVMKKIVFDVRCYLIIAVWMCLVPSIEWRLHQCMFNGTIDPLTSLLRFDPWSLHHILDDVLDGLPTLALKILLFGNLLLVHRQVMFSYGVDRNRPNYELVAFNRFFVRDREEEVEDEEEHVPNFEIKWCASRMIGSKGTLEFLRLLIFIVFMNTLIVFLLMFCPYRIGKLAITAMALQDKMLALHFEGLLTTLFGYFLITTFLYVVHAVATFVGLGSYKQCIWHCYTVVKVTLLMVVLMGVIPFATALWMDICSLSMFDITVKERIQSFYDSPVNFVFLHWLTGLTCLTCFIPIFEVFHKVTRPGLLWFLKNLIDYTDWFYWTPDLIKENMFYHCRKMIVSITLYATVIFVVVWIPARVVACVLPSFLPYTAPTEGYYLDEWSLLVRLLLVAMLKLVEAFSWAESAVRFWCVNVSRVLGMESYLLLGGAAPREANDNDDDDNDDDDDDDDTPAYVRPAMLVPRLFAVSVVAILTVVAIGLLMMTVPVSAIRLVMSLSATWLPAAPAAKPYRQMHVAEICMTLMNTYILHTQVGFAYRWLRTAWSAARTATAKCSKLFAEHPARTSVASAGLLFVAPRLLAVLLRLVVVVPSDVPAHQSPVMRHMQDVVFRLCCVGLSALLFVFAPARALGRAADGLANYRLAACAASLLLAVPYIIAYSAVPFAIHCRRAMMLIPPVAFPLLVVAAFIVKTAMMSSDVYTSVHQRILDDKYQLGKQLVNYDPKKAIAQR